MLGEISEYFHTLDGAFFHFSDTVGFIELCVSPGKKNLYVKVKFIILSECNLLEEIMLKIRSLK